MKEPTDNSGEFSEPKRRRGRAAVWLLGAIVALLLLVIAAQGLFNLWSYVPAETGSDTLLLYALSTLNFVAFVVFSFILTRSLLRLRRERHARQLGSKIQTRLLIYFIGLSLLPITAMAAFSYLFLNRSVEKWMGRLPENVVERVREQQREVTATQTRRLRESATLLAVAIRQRPENEWQSVLDQLAQSGELTAVEILSPDSEVVAHSETAVPEVQRAELKDLLDRGRRVASTETELSDGKGFDLISVPLTEPISTLWRWAISPAVEFETTKTPYLPSFASTTAERGTVRADARFAASALASCNEPIMPALSR